MCVKRDPVPARLLRLVSGPGYVWGCPRAKLPTFVFNVYLGALLAPYVLIGCRLSLLAGCPLLGGTSPVLSFYVCNILILAQCPSTLGPGSRALGAPWSRLPSFSVLCVGLYLLSLLSFSLVFPLRFLYFSLHFLCFSLRVSPPFPSPLRLACPLPP